MKLCFWRNNNGRYPAQEEVDSLDSWFRECTAKQLSKISQRTIQQAKSSGTLEKVSGVSPALKIQEVRFPLPKCEGRCLGVMVSDEVFLVTFFIKKKKKLRQSDINLAVKRANDLWGQEVRTGKSISEWAKEIIK